MARTDGLEKSSHAIARRGATLEAAFSDLGVKCRDRHSVGDITIKLTVTDTAIDGFGAKATRLSGWYTVDAATNPPDCRAGGHAQYPMYGERRRRQQAAALRLGAAPCR